MSEVTTTATEDSAAYRKLKKASAVLLLVGVIAVAIFFVALVAYAGLNDEGSFSISSGQNVASLVGATAAIIGWPALLAALIVRIVAAIKR